MATKINFTVTAKIQNILFASRYDKVGVLADVNSAPKPSLRIYQTSIASCRKVRK